MTEVQIKERLEKLEQAKQQTLANLNAIMGGIQECNYWLSVVTAPMPEPKADEKEKEENQKEGA